MEIWNQLAAVKSKPKLVAIRSALEAMHREESDKSQHQIDYDIKRSATYAEANRKIGGVAYYRQICLSLANLIVQRASVSTHFIPPSDETLAMGGFMGGENLVLTDDDIAEETTDRVLHVISEAS